MKECCKDTIAKVPEDEPVFLLRGKDLLAKNALASWLAAAIKAGVNPEKVQRAEQHLEDILQF